MHVEMLCYELAIGPAQLILMFLKWRFLHSCMHCFGLLGHSMLLKLMRHLCCRIG